MDTPHLRGIFKDFQPTPPALPGGGGFHGDALNGPVGALLDIFGSNDTQCSNLESFSRFSHEFGPRKSILASPTDIGAILGPFYAKWHVSRMSALPHGQKLDFIQNLTRGGVHWWIP